MARPRKQGLEYFPLDVDFFDDEKIVAISGEFGLKGEITVIKLLCAVYRNGYFILWSDMLKMKMLRSLPGVSSDLLDQIIHRLVVWGFFDKNLFDSARVLTSVGIQKRFFYGVKKRQPRDEYPYLLVSVPEIQVSAPETRISASEMPQSKVKKSKVNKISSDDDTKEPPLPPPPALSFSKTGCLEQERTRLQQDAEWKKPVCTRYAIPDERLRLLIDDFINHCLCESKPPHADLNDAKSHFIRWLNKQIREKGKVPTDFTAASRQAAEERERARVRRETEQRTREKNSCSHEQYQALLKRAQAGDKEAQRLLKPSE